MKRIKMIGIKWLSFLVCLTMLTNCVDNATSQSSTQDPKPVEKARKIQIALLLDTSNSMDGLIEQAKSQLWTIVNELAKAKCEGVQPELQIALYEYGNDNLPSSEGFIRMVTPLTSDLDKISQDLFELTTNGGNEFCGEVIYTSLKQLDWSSSTKDLQMIFIAGNEPFTQGSINYTTACNNAKEKKVVVNTIFCGDFNEGIRGSWKNGAVLTGGTYSSIEQNRKTVYIESPYDKKILELNNSLNSTYIPYGQKGYEKQQNQVKQDKNAESYSSVNSVKRAVSKSSHAYKNKSWDLVDAASEPSFEMEEIEDEALPQEMQKMDSKERQEYISKKSAERKKISSEIQELNKKRASYVAEQSTKSGSENSLDEAMIESIKKQAKEQKFVIE